MKKSLLCFILAFAFAFGCLFVPQSVSATQTDDFSQYSTYNWLEKFVTANPSRTTGTAGEQQTANWLADEISAMGFDLSKQTFAVPVSGVAGASGNADTCNVIAKKVYDQQAKTVVIGAHYDNATNLYNGAVVSGGEGAMDNGSGVAVVLAVMQKIYQQNPVLPFNLEFVFFGAEELGMLGSNHYVSKLSQQQKDNILLMINADVVASGDKLYVWGEDKNNPQSDYFADISGGKIVKTPANTKVMGINSGYRPYYSVCQMSDHMEFLSAGIPVAAFFSGNFDADSFSFVENAGKNDVSHTPNDTINYLKQNFGTGFAVNMQTVADVIYDGVIQNADEFATAVADARNYIVDDFWLSLGNASLIALVFMACAGIFAYNYYKKLQKRAILGTAEVKTNSVFEKPDEDDIFTFRS
ncbi:MAG: Zn-dependent exopeptidase M28 [Clostridia bacterium]|nr:Zn-dependent exopeptidase M28 [Clostridia bacterium]